MRLLQFHEYRAYLAAKVSAHELTPREVEDATAKARAIWPETGLSDWEAKPRPAGYAWISNDGKHIGTHVAADHDDCFVVIVSETSSLSAVGFIVFDVGAQYRQINYDCPSASFHGPADLAVIRDSVPRLNRHHDAYAILDSGGGSYMQAYQNADGSYDLEHQLVTLKCHYQATGGMGADDVVKAFESYAFGTYEWSTDFTWERIDL